MCPGENFLQSRFDLQRMVGALPPVVKIPGDHHGFAFRQRIGPVRQHLQLRLQQTVEGLSVAAIGYYVVSLFSYLAKGAKDAGYLPVDVGIATALFVPVALLLVWSMVRRIRRGRQSVPPLARVAVYSAN